MQLVRRGFKKAPDVARGLPDALLVLDQGKADVLVAVLAEADAGGDGNFANEPSPSTIMYFDQPNVAAAMSVDGGFTSVSFFYTSLWFPAVVTVLGGASGTTALATQVLPMLPSTCGGGDPTGAFSCWKEVTLKFSGVAQSIAWVGVGNFLGIDNIFNYLTQFGFGKPGCAARVLEQVNGTSAVPSANRGLVPRPPRPLLARRRCAGLWQCDPWRPPIRTPRSRPAPAPRGSRWPWSRAAR